jgi:hypothetical protein
MGEWRSSGMRPAPPEPPHAPATYWCDLRLTRRATSRSAVGKKMTALIEEAERLGFTFEAGTYGRDGPDPNPFR